MSNNQTTSLPAHVELIDMGFMAYLKSRLLFVAAELNLADHLADGPQAADAVATLTGSHPQSLYRLMRALAGIGVFSEDDDKRFSLTSLGAALRSAAPGHARSTLRSLCGTWSYTAWGNLLQSVKRGEIGFNLAYGIPIFEYFSQHPEEAALFSETMVGFNSQEPPAVAAAYDFSGAPTIVDVGGATGNMLATILKAHPQARGVLSDLSHVVREAPAFLAESGVADRIAIEAHDFFESVPAGGDLYIMSHVLHDWDDANCSKILASCKRAMPPKAKLLIVETVIPPARVPHYGKLLDIAMMAYGSGKERTEEEFAELLGKAGFRLSRVIATASAVSVVEAIRGD